MKTDSIITSTLSISLFGLFSCAGKYEVDYEAPVKIEFAGIDQNDGISLAGGIAGYTATVEVQGEVMSFEIYQTDSKTGMQGSLMEETAQSFADRTINYETACKFTSLKENVCVAVAVLDTDGHTYQRNLLIGITPSVLFSDPDYEKGGEIVETVSAYHGCCYATWLLGRTYMTADVTECTNEVDFSFRDIILPSGNEAAPVLVSPAKRNDYGLMTVNDLQYTLSAKTSLLQAESSAVSQVDTTPIGSLADPTSEVLAIQVDKVYLFKAVNGRKGLICIQKVTAGTSIIEASPNSWVKNTRYSWVQLLTKTVAK